MTDVLNNYFRLPDDWTGCLLSGNPVGEPSFFRFGAEVLCYGTRVNGLRAEKKPEEVPDALHDVRLVGRKVDLPFDPAEIVENFYRERYHQNLRSVLESIVMDHRSILKLYYALRGALPVPLRRCLQRAYFSNWQNVSFPAWPVDCTVNILHQELLKLAMLTRGVRRVPFIWFWPEGASSCLILTHDVETAAGRDFTSGLMDLDESYGFKASFQVVPEKRYQLSGDYVQEIRDRGFEFNIHDLNHEGNLYENRAQFVERAKRINQYVRRFNARGFRAGCMYRNADWYDAFEFSYDMSIPNVAHFEPKRGGCCTILPFFIGNVLELPLTTIQDYSLFYILNKYSLEIWKKQLDVIRQRHGLMSFISHPDYLISRRARELYESLLDYLRHMIAGENIWTALPRDVDDWWRARSRMKLVPSSSGWTVQGPESERARIAYAVLDSDRVSYELS